MAYPGRNNIYEAAIRRMVDRALETQEQAFAAEHSADSDEQLLDHLCSCAAALGHTPWPGEMAGGSLIRQRFGAWENALLKGKLPAPSTPDKVTAFARYQEETRRQQVLYRENKAAKKQKAQQRLKAQKERQAV